MVIELCIALFSLDKGIICLNFVCLAEHLVELVIFAFPTGEGWMGVCWSTSHIFKNFLQTRLVCLKIVRLWNHVEDEIRFQWSKSNSCSYCQSHLTMYVPDPRKNYRLTHSASELSGYTCHKFTNNEQEAAECSIENFEFIASEWAQVNPDNSWQWVY